MPPKDRYRFQRAMNKLGNFLWSTAMKLLVLIIGIVIFIFALPWLKMLWDTISGSEFKN